jgi:hypothetical protein
MCKLSNCKNMFWEKLLSFDMTRTPQKTKQLVGHTHTEQAS